MKLGPRFKQIFRCSFLLLIAISSLISLTQQPAYAHDSAGYSHDSGSKTSNPRWMGQLASGKKLSSVSIIGTHDTMSRFGGVFVETQTMSLMDQLNSGIRALDIRVRKAGDRFAIHHGPFFQNAMFGDVLQTVVAFLKANPSEFILMKVQHESNAGNGDQYSNPSPAERTRIMRSYLDDEKFSGFFLAKSTR